MRLLRHKHGEALCLPTPPDTPEQVHVFDQTEIDAIHAALAARRPLLIRGEPGTGKTQLAKAAALDLGRAFVSHTVDVRTEARDLLWHFDAIARLADAQICGALKEAKGGTDAGQALPVENYLHPRALWWAYAWEQAQARAEALKRPAPALMPGCDSANGCVVLIDEIDKAETDVPNGLLQALGEGSFTPEGMIEPVVNRGVPPLVIITSNEERTLPDAFLRRCLVLLLSLPAGDEELIAHLVSRGRAHFPNADQGVLKEAAEKLVTDRRAAAENHWRPLPGQAEYLDLVRAVLELGKDAEAQRNLLATLRRFVLHKNQGMPA